MKNIFRVLVFVCFASTLFAQAAKDIEASGPADYLKDLHENGVTIKFAFNNHDPLYEPKTFLWEFGDYKYSLGSGNPVSHSFKHPGLFRVSLIAIDAHGHERPFSMLVRVNLPVEFLEDNPRMNPEVEKPSK